MARSGSACRARLGSDRLYCTYDGCEAEDVGVICVSVNEAGLVLLKQNQKASLTRTRAIDLAAAVASPVYRNVQ